MSTAPSSIRCWRRLARPPAVVARLNEALNAAVATPEQKQDLSRRGFVAMGGTPQQLGDWLKVQEPIWVPVLQAAGIKPE